MTKKNKKILLIIALVFVALGGFLIIARVITGEDVWLCVNGTWQRHGNPSSAMPTSGCSNVNSNRNINTNTNSNINNNNNSNTNNNTNTAISTFDECVAAGNSVQESYPRKCSANGKTFTEDIGNELEKIDLIKIDSPRPNSTVYSPIAITGEARGTWYNEGVLNIDIEDASGNILGQVLGQAQAEWMTEDFVPFKATLTFKTTTQTKVYLVIHKANSSGLPGKADELKIPLAIASN